MEKSEPQWIKLFGAQSSVLFQWFIFKGECQNFKPKIGLDFSFKNGKFSNSEIFYDANELGALEGAIRSKFASDTDFLKDYIDSFYASANDLLEFSENYLQSKEPSLLYQDYEDRVLGIMPFMTVPGLLANILQDQAQELLREKISINTQKEIDNILRDLLTPQKESLFVKERREMVEMAIKMQKGEKPDIDSYLEKYTWTSSQAYLGGFKNRENVLDELKEIVEEGPMERKKKSLSIAKERNKKYSIALRLIEDSSELTGLVQALQELFFIQTYKMDVLHIAHYYFSGVLYQIEDSLGLDRGGLVWLTGREIKMALNGSLEVDPVTTKDRKSGFSIIKKDKIIKVSLTDQQKEESAEEVDVLKGVVANTGRSTGRAKILIEDSDMKKVNYGDIVVSPMTYPNLVPALNKASGIVTDVGGILCHAALISRELGTPCVIDTKEASKVIKDGDLIELNAYEGVVTVIEKHKE